MPKFQITFPPDVHKEIKIKAAEAEKSMNQYILDCLKFPLIITKNSEFNTLKEEVEFEREKAHASDLLDPNVKLVENPDVKIYGQGVQVHAANCLCLLCNPK